MAGLGSAMCCDCPATASFTQVLRESLVASPTVQLEAQYLDVSRFGGDAHDRALADWLRARYSGRRLSVVLALGVPPGRRRNRRWHPSRRQAAKEGRVRPRILLADDQAIVAEGLARLVEDVAELVGQVNDGLPLLDETRRLRPEIVVADITMPGMSGIDAMRQRKAEGSDARFIFLTIHTEARLAAEAMRSGASGYLLKQAAGNELFDAIQAVTNGRTYLTPSITGDVPRNLSAPPESAERGVSRSIAAAPQTPSS